MNEFVHSSRSGLPCDFKALPQPEPETDFEIARLLLRFFSRILCIVIGLTILSTIMTDVGGLQMLVAQQANPTATLTSLNIGATPAHFSGSGAALGTYRVEFRVENAQPLRTILSNGQGVGGLNCSIDLSGQLLCSQGGDATPQGIPAYQSTAGQDIRVRFQRDAAQLTYTLETWSGDCAGYSRRQLPVSNAGSLTQTSLWTFGPSINLAFVRGLSALDSSGDCPVDSPSLAGDLFDFTFEGNLLQDRSAHAYTMIADGTTFVPSATYPPRAVISGQAGFAPVFIASIPFVLSGAASVGFSFPGTGVLSSYLWQQLSGPESSSIANTTGSDAQITAAVAGQYTYQLTVTDGNGQTGSTVLTVGIVAANATGVVVPQNDDLTVAVGAATPDGSSPWPWYELTEAADINLLAPLMQKPPAETPGPGTCTIPSGSPNQLSRGLITAFLNGGVTILCSGSNFTSADIGTRIALNWDANGDGTYKGRFVAYINNVLSPTEVVDNAYFISEPPSALANSLSWGRLGTDLGPYNANDPNSYILMFYEAGLAVERMYEKTGLTVYQTQFHSFCDNWWYWALDSGYGYAIPRNSGLHTMIACAADPSYNRPPNMWAGIARLTQTIGGDVTTTAGAEPAYNPTDPIVVGTPDIREISYVLRPTALLARLYRKHGGDAVAWCGYLANQLNNMWIRNASVPANAPTSNYAFWEENLFLNNISYVAASHPAGDPNGHFGTSPWRSAGLPTLALIYSYEALSDPEACNDPVLANQLFNPSDGSGLIAKAANYMWDYGRYADGGVLYAEGYDTDTGNTLGWTVFNAVPANGSVTVNTGATAVIGSSTYFTAQFGPCDGSTNIVINGATYGVAGCIDDTHLTLSTPFHGPAANGTSSYSNPATVAVTQGSVRVIGTGTRFTVLFAPCDGTTYIGIVGNQNPTVDRRVYQVMGCADDTHLMLNLPYAGPTEGGLNVFSRAHQAHQSCGPLSLSARCEPDRYNGRNLSMDIAASAAWLYAQTGVSSWKQRAEYYVNKSFGGSANGAGSLGPPTGSVVYSRPGTIAVTAGVTTIVGSGTKFLTQFACNSTDGITVADKSGGYTWANYPGLEPAFYTITVASCDDDTHLILASRYPGSTADNVSMFYNAADSEWQGADGGTGNLGEILPACGSSAPPCGIGDLDPKYGKPLGMASGTGNTPEVLADLLSGSGNIYSVVQGNNHAPRSSAFRDIDKHGN